MCPNKWIIWTSEFQISGAPLLSGSIHTTMNLTFSMGRAMHLLFALLAGSDDVEVVGGVVVVVVVVDAEAVLVAGQVDQGGGQRASLFFSDLYGDQICSRNALLLYKVIQN